MNEVKDRIGCVLDGFDGVELDRERPTPGGSSTGRDVLLWVVSLAAQHYGAAQLTRDLVMVRQEAAAAGAGRTRAWETGG